jgi:prevent-host-death family protein
MTDRSVSMPEAQGKLPGLIRAAEEGEAVQMARWGAPVAVLVSVARDQKLRPHKQKGAARSLPDHPPKTPWNPGPPCRCPRQRNRAGSPVFTLGSCRCQWNVGSVRAVGQTSLSVAPS